MANGKWEKCARCQCDMWLPAALEESARALNDKLTFYCPYGHPQHYPAGETEEVKLRRERDRLKQQIAYKDDEIEAERANREAAERRAAAFRGVATRLKKRSLAGTCSCCNRTFSNMAEHMKTCHPEQITEAGGKVVKLQRKRA